MNTKFHPQWLRLTAVLSLLFAVLASVSPAYADTCLVTSNADSGAGSLREKIADPLCDTITFDGDHTIVLASQLTIGRNVTIDGAGHGVTISGNHAVRVFYIDWGVTFNLNNLTVANGNVGTSGVGGGIYNNRGTLNVTNGAFSGNNAATGGGIYSDGDALTVTSSTFTGNSATIRGGGIYNDIGTTNVASSTFTDNSAAWDGGGIYVNSGTVTVAGSDFNSNYAELGAGIHSSGTLSVTDSTFSDNRAQYTGGGISNTSTLNVMNSTFSGNSVDFGSGGGILNNTGGTVTLTNSTFHNNSAINGGGIANFTGTVTLTNTIMANSTSGANCVNIVGSNNLADDETCGPGFSVSSSILLGPLSDNGGPTQTMALLPGSAAIDAGDDAACPATDQRGVARPQGAHCDIGAYEAEITTDDNTPTANPGGPYLGAVNTSIVFDGSLSSDPENDPLTYAWTFGDGATGTDAAPTHSYTAVGIYDVCLTVNDGSLASDPACTMAVIYDPSAGFVTGGGWIDSPAGSYKADESLAGKATFGFVSKYQKGASVPTGTTAFEFDLAGLAFSSESYEWLVVNQGGSNAQFKGSGLINGAADPNGDAYKFQLWASDGSSTNSADTFRIRVWWEDAAGEHDVYDNGVNQVIDAGNIVVHTGK